MPLRRTPRLAAFAALAACTGGSLAFAAHAFAQRFETTKPLVVQTGPARGLAPTARIDARRTGHTTAPLPSDKLYVAFRKPLGLSLEHPPIVDANGNAFVVPSRGEVVVLDALSGEERARLTIAASNLGPATLLSDGTLAFATSGGEAIFVRDGRIRARTRIAPERTLNPRAAPLPLLDGGVAFATTTELLTLDGEGEVRARVTLKEAASAPLVSFRDRVVVVGASGAVFTWKPGSDLVRCGTFGAAIDGSAALMGDTSLVAVASATTTAAVDLATCAARTTSTSLAGMFLGPVTTFRDTVLVFEETTSAMLVVAIAPDGSHPRRSVVATVPIAQDAGAPAFGAARGGLLVGADGTVAFASTTGHIGSIASDGTVHTLGESICGRSSPRGTPVPVGIAPAPERAFLVACDGGTVARIASR